MIPESIATTSARDVVRLHLLHALGAVIGDLTNSNQLESHDALELSNEVSKALLGIPESVGEVEVLKSLPYGEQPEAEASLSEYGKYRIAKTFYEDTMQGYTPVSKAAGYVPPADMEDFRADVADCLMREFNLGCDDALDCAETFFGLFGR